MSCVIGIDPGQHTGVAEVNHDGAISNVITTDFWDAYDYIVSQHTPASAVVVVEQGGANRPTFEKGSVYAEAAQNKVSQNIGGANREADLLALGLKRRGFHVVQVRPTKTKWSADECARITGYTKRTNNHERDALRLAFDYYRTQRLLLRTK